MGRASDILALVEDIQAISEAIPWGKGSKGVLDHLDSKFGDDTKKKVSSINRAKSKLKDPEKLKTYEKVLAKLQGDEPEKEPSDIKAKIADALGPDDSPEKEEKAKPEKDGSAKMKDEIDAAMGDEEKPKKEKKKASDIKDEISNALEGDEPEPDEEEPKKKKPVDKMKSDIDAALGDKEADEPEPEKESSDKKSVDDVKSEIDTALGDEETGEPKKKSSGEKSTGDMKAEIDAALSPDGSDTSLPPEKEVPPEHPTVSGETLGGGPGMTEVSSIYAKKADSSSEEAKALKKINKFCQKHPKTAEVIAAGIGGINRAVSFYHSAKAYKEHPTSSSGFVSKHPVIASALVGGPTGLAASASFLARREGEKARAQVWEKVADFAAEHPKTAEVLSGGGMNPALAYHHASKQKKTKKPKATKETGPQKIPGTKE